MKKLFSFFAAAICCGSLWAQEACNSALMNVPDKVTGIENNNMYVIEWDNPTGDLVNPEVGFSFWYQTTFMASRSLYIDYKTTTDDWAQLGAKIASDGNGRTITDRKLPANATGVRFRYQGGVVGSCAFSSVVIPMNTYMELNNAPDSLVDEVEATQTWTSTNVAIRYCDVPAVIAEITDFVSVNEVHDASCLTVSAVNGDVESACGTFGNAEYLVSGSFTGADTIQANLSLTTATGMIQVVPVYLIITADTPTALSESVRAEKAVKFLENGILFLRKGDALYDMRGQRLR